MPGVFESESVAPHRGGGGVERVYDEYAGGNVAQRFVGDAGGMPQHLVAYALRVCRPCELCEQDRWLSSISQTPQLQAVSSPKRHLCSAQSVYTGHTTVAESQPDCRLLRLAQGMFSQPQCDALAGWTGYRLERIDRIAETRKRLHNGVAHAHVRTR